MWSEKILKLDDKRGIKQFDGTEFECWKYTHEVYMFIWIKRIIHFSIKKLAFKINYRNAISILVQFIADSYLEYDQKANTSEEIWEKHLVEFERSGVLCCLHLLCKLLTIKYNNVHLVEVHIIKCYKLVKQFKSSGTN